MPNFGGDELWQFSNPFRSIEPKLLKYPKLGSTTSPAVNLIRCTTSNDEYSSKHCHTKVIP